MKKKQIIITISILLVIGFVIFLMLFFKQKEKNFETRYIDYFNSQNDIFLNNKKTKLETKNDDEKIIKKYYDDLISIKNKINDLKYEKFIENNPLNDLFFDIEEYKNKIELNKNSLINVINDFKKINNKNYFFEYLKGNNFSEKGIDILEKNIDSNKFNNKFLEEEQQDNEVKFKKINDYINYLELNQNNWKFEDNKILTKTEEILNYIDSQNKNLGIDLNISIEINNNLQIPVFMYHGVSDEPWGISSIFLSVAKFEEQMKFLHDNNYKTIFLDELDKAYNYEKTVILTFDDGYNDFYINVLPILKKYNIKANLYVISGFINGDIYITTDQLKEIVNSNLVSIGSHTVSHPSLNSLTNEQIEEQLKKSKETLKEITGQEVNTLAYPKGHYDSRVLEISQKYYKYALLVNGGIEKIDSNFNPVKIRRVGINSDMSINTFKKYCEQAK